MPTFRAASSTSTAQGESIVLNTPTGTAENDILIAYLIVEHVSGGAPAITAPGGWTELQGLTRTEGDDARSHLYWRRAVASEPATHTFSWTGSLWNTGVICAYSGAPTTGDPSDGTPVTTLPTGADGSIVLTEMTTITAGAVLLVMCEGSNSGNHTYPGGTAERADTSWTSIGDEDRPTAGATGSRTVTFALSASNFRSGILAALAPAPSTRKARTLTGVGL
jgi:hypothetical protein